MKKEIVDSAILKQALLKKDNSVAEIVQMACSFDCSIYFQAKNKKVNAKSIMGMMAVIGTSEDEFEFIADGSDEEKAMELLMNYIDKK